MKKKVVLAYSGGLDTSCAVKWLNEQGYKVVCFIADLGQGIDFSEIEKRALALGASEVYVRDLKKEFACKFVVPALKANAVYEGRYFLATALGRPLIARHLVDIAHKEKAQTVAHGCSGKGNDQVRLEVTISILDPTLKIIAPLRIWEFKSREEEIAYLEKAGIATGITRKKPYSIDKNLWGVSIEAGILEDPSVEPPPDIYQITNLSEGISSAKYIRIAFKKGIPYALDRKIFKNIEKLIFTLNKIGGGYGIGRTDLIEDRLVGIKSREIYEAPAATILYNAHKELESLVLDRELLHFKEIVSLKYAQLVYYGLWYSPLKQALDEFIEATQRNVSGEVKVKLSAGNCVVVGRNSVHSLYNRKLATYGKEDIFNQKLAEGFIKIFAMPYAKTGLQK
jgi:argininosuccinate synthase